MSPLMPEREKNRPTTSEEWMEHVYEFIYKWEVGSPEHRAVSDFLNLQRLYSEFGEKPDDYQSKISGASSLSQEQREARDLQKIALLEHTIEQNLASIPGYSNVKVYLTATFDDLFGAASSEANAKFPDNTEKQSEYVKETFERVLSHALDRVGDMQYNDPYS
jgi:hypothetical protein